MCPAEVKTIIILNHRQRLLWLFIYLHGGNLSVACCGYLYICMGATCLLRAVVIYISAWGQPVCCVIIMNYMRLVSRLGRHTWADGLNEVPQCSCTTNFASLCLPRGPPSLP